MALPCELWRVCGRVCEPLTNADLPPFLWLPTSPLLPPPLSRLRPPLSHFLSLRDLITPLLISFDRRQLIRGQHLDGSHGNRQDQIFRALKGGSRSLAEGAVGGNEKFPEIDSFDGERRTEDWMATLPLIFYFFFFLVCGCMCYLISPESCCPSHGPSGKGWSGGLFVCASVCMCERVQGYRWSYFLTVPKGSEQPQQWLQLINTFIRTIVFFFQ